MLSNYPPKIFTSLQLHQKLYQFSQIPLDFGIDNHSTNQEKYILNTSQFLHKFFLFSFHLLGLAIECWMEGVISSILVLIIFLVRLFL